MSNLNLVAVSENQVAKQNNQRGEETPDMYIYKFYFLAVFLENL